MSARPAGATFSISRIGSISPIGAPEVEREVLRRVDDSVARRLHGAHSSGDDPAALSAARVHPIRAVARILRGARLFEHYTARLQAT